MLGYEGIDVINPEGGKDDAEEEAQRGRWKQETLDKMRELVELTFYKPPKILPSCVLTDFIRSEHDGSDVQVHLNVEHHYEVDVIPNMSRSPRVKYITYYEDSDSLPGKRTVVWELDKGMRVGPNSGKLVIMFMQLGAKLPLYAFKRVNKIVGEKGLIALDYIEPSIAFLDSLLLGEWEDRMQRGLFRYDVTACETKVIPGEYGFIAQLNEGRHLKMRPTEFRVDKVLQPFDGNKFNFTKVGQEEVLFQFEASDEDNETQFFPNAPIDVENSPSVVAINVSPIEYGHVLLIPWILECLPQRIDRVSFLLALYMAAEAGNPYFRLGYNSLGAFATINHLHFQAYYLAVPFPIEKAQIREITTLNGGVKISELLNYPVRGLVFEGGNTLEDLPNAASDSCICLQDNNVPYNVLISESGKRIYPFVIYPFSFSTVGETLRCPSFRRTVPDSDYWWFCFQEIMHNPQVAADGFTYEGDALRGWLENGRETSPMTNLRLDHLHLTPNHALRLAIQDWLCKV
ncbi:hypothetical protein HYC85_012179 [Camellia sinensis]|uniref:U-box domain-containing protein n=1 Tax=Camellia sinensis TaxID=4442 RepID=A0A7J7HEG2_CAMSI|nr:hypothetical protein HYC85_012179 [Camellia sinensis]